MDPDPNGRPEAHEILDAALTTRNQHVLDNFFRESRQFQAIFGRSGRHYSFGPNPPIWIGGNSNRAMRRAIELADGWNPMPSPARASRMLRTPPIETVDDLVALYGEPNVLVFP